MGKKEKRQAMYRRGLEAFSAWLSGLNPPLPRPEAALV